MKPLLPVEEALHTLLTAARAVRESETVTLLEARGRVLAQDVTAPLDVPAFDNSAMDGYAVRADEISGEASTSLPVSQRIAAGQQPEPLRPATAGRIFTGAPVPPGADAVVMQEQCEVGEDGSVRIKAEVKPGQNIRRAGEDIAAGSVLLAAGTPLRAQELGLLASIGIDRIDVKRRVGVAVFFTGDELVEPGQPLGAGQIYNSNRYMVVALLQELGCRVTDLGIVRDSLEATRAALRQAMQDHDVVLTCGGVSVGEEDHVKAAVEAEGSLMLWQIAIKPGKPLAFGRVGPAYFVGLPGNPVSSFVTFKVLVAPFLQALSGAAIKETALELTAGFDWPKADKRREYLRVRRETRDGQTVAAAFRHQGSGVLTSCSFADGLLEVEPGAGFRRGERLKYWPF